MSNFSRNIGRWQATKFAREIKYVERIGFGPNRRCDTVMLPDFFES